MIDETEIYSKTVIKDLLISAVLYLPISFFIWFYASSLLVIPVKYLLQLVTSMWQPDLFNAVSQHQYLLNVETLIFPSQKFAGQGDKLAVLDVTVNPMIYGYGIAVIAGLVISTPGLTAAKKALQIFIGYLLIILIQTFGSFWEMTKHLLLTGGPDAQQAILDTGLPPNLIALMYQMSYLILPAVIPIAYWIMMNNKFIGQITGLNVNELTNGNFDKVKVSEQDQKEK